MLFLKILFIYLFFWPHWVFVAIHELLVAAHGIFLVVAKGGYSLVAVHGLLTVVASVVEHVL